MARMPGAIWSPSPNFNKGGVTRPARGVVLHTADGTVGGTVGWQHNPASEVSSYFVTGKDGSIFQCVDTDDKAWTQGTGNEAWIGIENEGHGETGDPLTAKQLAAVALIYAWCHAQYGIPFTITDTPNARGLGWHGMGASIGWGHPGCPGEAIKAQRAEILEVAQGVHAASGPQTEDLLTTVAVGVAANGRDSTARPIPAFDAVLLENGARVAGDKPSGGNFTWIPDGLLPGSKLIDIAALSDPEHPFTALYRYTNGAIGTYRAARLGAPGHGA